LSSLEVSLVGISENREVSSFSFTHLYWFFCLEIWKECYCNYHAITSTK